MKSKFLFITLLFSCLAFIGMGGCSPKMSPGSGLKTGSHPIPVEISKIMENSCYVCHGAGGRAMALARLNLTEWNAYTSEKQVKKAAQICKMVSKRKMPLKGYVKENPGKALTQAQIDLFCQWSSSLKKGGK